MGKFITIFVIIATFALPIHAEEKEKRSKVQKMNFDGEDVDGKVRQPDGSYIVQKRGIDFIPLYKLRDNFDDQIEQSIEYVK